MGKIERKIIDTARRFLVPPDFPGDAEKTRGASVLHAVLVAYLVLLPISLFLIVFVYENKVINALIVLALIILYLICYMMMRRGAVQRSSQIFLLTQWVIYTLFVATSGGPSSAGIVFYLGAVVMAGVLLGQFAAIAYAFASSLIVLVIFVLPTAGVVIPRFFPLSGLAAWFDLTLTLGMTALAINITLNGLRAALASAHNELLERRAAEQALRESEERYRTLFESASDAIFLFDQTTLEIIDCNSAACRLYGYSRAELIHTPISFVSAEPERSERAARAGEQHVPLRYHRRKDGHVFPVEINAGPFKLGGRDVLVSFVRDISARHQAEEEVRRLNVDLERRVAQRTAELEMANRELESFSYSVSHDLRAPLRHLNGYSQMLVEENAETLSPQARHSLERIQAAGLHMGQLIDGLLGLSRVGRSELHLSQVNLSAVAHEIADDLVRRDPQRAVDFEIADGLVARADPALMRSVLENLLENAWKFSSRRQRAHIVFGCQAGKERVFYVRDNGAGFDMEYKSQLFGVFRRLHAPGEYPGTGIGLASAQRIIQRHGGRIWAEGAVEQGAVFYFTLE
jgi:PAS domain S-box-containing protein